MKKEVVFDEPEQEALHQKVKGAIKVQRVFSSTYQRTQEKIL